jgi:Arc/MetJ family transcription regulator
MRVNVDIDDDLLAEAMRASGKTTKRATVEEALTTLVRLREDYLVMRKLREARRSSDPDKPRRSGDV